MQLVGAKFVGASAFVGRSQHAVVPSSARGRRAQLRVTASSAPGGYSQPPQPVGTPVNGGPSRSLPMPAQAQSIFANIESMIQATFSSTQPGQRGDWQEVEGSYVLYPPAGRPPSAVAHFLGGAFVGAAPQVAYRLLLEALANRDILVIATPYSTSLDQLRTADEAQFKFDRALRALGPEAASLPTYGVGHSLGGLLHLLISARYAVQRAGNVVLGFNARPATDVIPFLSPLIAPSARMLGPVLSQVAASPLRSTAESALDTLKGLSPSAVRGVLPLVEQLAPMVLDVAQGKQEFLPAPEEARNLIRTYYGVSRNMLLRFRDDSIDDTNGLVALLQSTAPVGSMLDLTVRTVPGDHLRPMHQAIVDLPPEVARLASGAVSSTGGALGRLAAVANQMGVQQASAPLEELSRGVSGMAGVFGGQVGGPVTDSMQALADEMAAWMGSSAVAMSGTRALPAVSSYSAGNGSMGPSSSSTQQQYYSQY